MNDTGSLRGLGAVADGPLPDLVGTGGEERAQVQRLTHGDDGLGQSRRSTNVLALLVNLRLGLETRETLFEADGDGNDGVTSGVLLDPLGNLGKVLVLLANVVPLAQVDEVDDGLGGKKEEGVDCLNLKLALALYKTWKLWCRKWSR